MVLKVLMLKRVGPLLAVLDLAREGKVRVTGIDYPFERARLLEDDFDYVAMDGPECRPEWREKYNQWCDISEYEMLDYTMRHASLDLNFLVNTLAETENTREILYGSTPETARIRKAFTECMSENYRLKQFFHPQVAGDSLVADLPTKHRVFDLFGMYLKNRVPQMHVFVRWKNLAWVDGITTFADQVEFPVPLKDDSATLWRALFKANFIPARRNPVHAKSHMPKRWARYSEESRADRFLVEVGIGNTLDRWLEATKY